MFYTSYAKYILEYDLILKKYLIDSSVKNFTEEIEISI